MAKAEILAINDKLLDEYNSALIKALAKSNDRMRSALSRARTVLGNMAEENEGAIFRRWPINHEPLRADAKNLLPVIDAALGERDD